MPKVSVILPSYNHGPFVGQAIESVLSQSFTDYELLISDDGSTDTSVVVLRSYRDPRIRLHVFEHNQGASLNHRYLLQHCQGEYIALINSDDVWLPGRLEKGVRYLDAHPMCGAVFSWAGIIDETNRVLVEDCDIFHQPNRTRAEWLRHFFTKANCLCHPSMLIRREAYQQAGYYSLGMRQLPDFWMWVCLAKRMDIHVLQEVLVQHRRFMATNQNTSAPLPDNSVRDVNESLYILMHFFDDMDDALFKEAFGRLFRHKDASTPVELLCEKYFLLADNHYYMGKIYPIAAQHFYLQYCNRVDVIEAMRNDYDYSQNDFYKLGTLLDLASVRPARQNTVPATDPIFHKSNWLKRRFGDTAIYDRVRRLYRHMTREDTR